MVNKLVTTLKMIIIPWLSLIGVWCLIFLPLLFSGWFVEYVALNFNGGWHSSLDDGAITAGIWILVTVFVTIPLYRKLVVWQYKNAPSMVSDTVRHLFVQFPNYAILLLSLVYLVVGWNMLEGKFILLASVFIGVNLLVNIYGWKVLKRLSSTDYIK